MSQKRFNEGDSQLSLQPPDEVIKLSDQSYHYVKRGDVEKKQNQDIANKPQDRDKLAVLKLLGLVSTKTTLDKGFLEHDEILDGVDLASANNEEWS